SEAPEEPYLTYDARMTPAHRATIASAAPTWAVQAFNTLMELPLIIRFILLAAGVMLLVLVIAWAFGAFFVGTVLLLGVLVGTLALWRHAAVFWDLREPVYVRTTGPLDPTVQTDKYGAIRGHYLQMADRGFGVPRAVAKSLS